jgi:hypothetical protein
MFATFARDQGRFGEFDDQMSYQKVILPYVDHFASLLLMGMMLETEAWHLRGDAIQAQQAVSNVWSDLRTVYQAGGYPLSNNTVVTQNSTDTVWSRSPVCTVATFDSKEAANHFADKDPVNVALAVTAANFHGVPGPSWQAGDRICSLRVGGAFSSIVGRPSALLSALVSQAKPGMGALQWGVPQQSQYQSLVRNRGPETPLAYLNAHGFQIGAVGRIHSPNLISQESDLYRYFDTQSDQAQCLFNATCPDSAIAGMQAVAPAPCYLGSGAFKGIGTECGTAWLDQRWPEASPH